MKNWRKTGDLNKMDRVKDSFYSHTVYSAQQHRSTETNLISIGNFINN